jgi:hypothetical protein
MTKDELYAYASWKSMKQRCDNSGGVSGVARYGSGWRAYTDKSVTLYRGPSLEAAIAARQTWEVVAWKP